MATPRHARLFEPVASHHASRSTHASSPAYTATWYKRHTKWSSKSNVPSTRFFEHAMRKPAADLAAVVGSNVDTASMAHVKATYALFGSDTESKYEGNLLTNPGTVSAQFGMTYAYAPSHMVLRLDNVSGELLIERPRCARVFVCERFSEPESWTSHILETLEPVLCVRTEHRGLATTPATELVSYNDGMTIDYSVQRYAVPATNSAVVADARPMDAFDRPASAVAVAPTAEEHPSSATVASLLSSDCGTLSVHHHTSHNGELETSVAGNVAYRIVFHKARALIHIRLNPLVTRVRMTNMTGNVAELYTGFSARANNVNLFLATEPAAALSTTEGVQAMAAALGIAPVGFEGRSLNMVLAEMHPLASLIDQEASRRREALARMLTFDTKYGRVYLRNEPLSLRTNDNIHYMAFLLVNDVRSFLPLCCLVRRSEHARSLQSNPGLPPFRVYHVDSQTTTNSIASALEAYKESPRAMNLYLDQLFGLTVVSYKAAVPVTEPSASNTLEAIRSFGCPLPAVHAPEQAPQPAPVPTPPVSIPDSPVAPPLSASSATVAAASDSYLDTMTLVESGSITQVSPSPPPIIERRSTRVNIGLFADLLVAGRPIVIKPYARPVPITSEAPPLPPAQSNGDVVAAAAVQEHVPEPVHVVSKKRPREEEQQDEEKERPLVTTDEFTLPLPPPPQPARKKYKQAKSDDTGVPSMSIEKSATVTKRASKRSRVSKKMLPQSLISDIEFDVIQKNVTDHSKPIMSLQGTFPSVFPLVNDPQYAFNAQYHHHHQQQHQHQNTHLTHEQTLQSSLFDFNVGTTMPAAASDLDTNGLAMTFSDANDPLNGTQLYNGLDDIFFT